MSSLTIRQFQPAVDQKRVARRFLRADDLVAPLLQLQAEIDPLSGTLLKSEMPFFNTKALLFPRLISR